MCVTKPKTFHCSLSLSCFTIMLPGLYLSYYLTIRNSLCACSVRKLLGHFQSNQVDVSGMCHTRRVTSSPGDQVALGSSFRTVWNCLKAKVREKREKLVLVASTDLCSV